MAENLVLDARCKYYVHRESSGKPIIAMAFHLHIPPDSVVKRGERPAFRLEEHVPSNPPKPPRVVEGNDLMSCWNDNDRTEWHVMGEVKHLNARVVLSARWTAESGESWSGSREFRTGNQVNVETDVFVEPVSVQLSRLLLGPLSAREEARHLSTGSQSDSECVSAITRHVHKRLLAGLGELWALGGLYACKNGRPLSECDPDTLDGSELQEAWAQAISEQIVGSCYAGAGPFMGARSFAPPNSGWADQHKMDAGFLQDIREAQRTGNNCHPLVFACQQLCTWVWFTLGYDTVADFPLDASFGASGSTVLGRRDIAGVQTAAGLAAAGFLSPGACLYVNGTRHVGVILRNFGANLVQLLDTGAWWFDRDMPEGSGNHDTATRPDINTGRICDHIIALPVESPDAAATRFRTSIKRLRSSRPLGCARLVIRKRASHDVVWRSERVPLYEVVGDAQRGYSISHLIASLRGCPHTDRYEVTWFVWGPEHVDPRPPSKSLKQLLGDATGDAAMNKIRYAILFGRQTDMRPGWWHLPPTDVNAPARRALSQIEIKTSGVPHVVGRARDGHYITFPADADGQATALPDGGANIPVFFGGNVSLNEELEELQKEAPPVNDDNNVFLCDIWATSEAGP
ncbi:MAG: hypothetical protein QM784_20315 [Polyangiaceae bacterium]